MNIAILADIHGNLPALEAVLAHIDRRGDIAALYHLGDLVGYAPWPNEVVALLREREIPGIAGNYDSTVAHDHDHCGCRYEDPRQEALAHESYEWTRRHVDAETRRYLGSLPFRLDLRPGGGHRPGPSIVLVHGTPTINTLYWTEDRTDDFCIKMASTAGMRAGDTVVFGHTHIPWERTVEGIRFVNAGSVGRPKDGDPRACYALLDTAATPASATFLRVDYDLERAERGIRDSGLPDAFATYLRSGGRTVIGSSAPEALRPDPS